MMKIPHVDSTFNIRWTFRLWKMIIPLAFCLETIPQRTSSEIYTEKLSLRDSLTFIQRRSYPRTMEPLWPDGGSKIPRCISGISHLYPSQTETLRRTPYEINSRRRNGHIYSPMSR